MAAVNIKIDGIKNVLDQLSTAYPRYQQMVTNDLHNRMTVMADRIVELNPALEGKVHVTTEITGNPTTTMTLTVQLPGTIGHTFGQPLQVPSQPGGPTPGQPQKLKESNLPAILGLLEFAMIPMRAITQATAEFWGDIEGDFAEVDKTEEG